MSEKPAEQPPPAPDDGTPAPESGDADFRRALTIVRESAEASEKRIAALRAAIASGAYKPDPHEIARKILEHGL